MIIPSLVCTTPIFAFSSMTPYVDLPDHKFGQKKSLEYPQTSIAMFFGQHQRGNQVKSKSLCELYATNNDDDDDDDDNNNGEQSSTNTKSSDNKAMAFLRKIGKVGGAANKDFVNALGVDEGPVGKNTVEAGMKV